MKTDVTCYNNNTSGCPGASNVGHILEKDVYTTLPGFSSPSHIWQSFDYFGDVTETKTYDVGGVAPISDEVVAYGSYNSSGTCSSIGANILNRVCTDTTTNSTGTLRSWVTSAYPGRR